VCAGAAKGLNKMAMDITKSFLRRMAAEGIKLDAGLFDRLLSTYLRQPEATLRFYAAIAEFAFARRAYSALAG
jgi:glucosyl-3-phosphoglycerate synthase